MNRDRFARQSDQALDIVEGRVVPLRLFGIFENNDLVAAGPVQITHVKIVEILADENAVARVPGRPLASIRPVFGPEIDVIEAIEGGAPECRRRRFTLLRIELETA